MSAGLLESARGFVAGLLDLGRTRFELFGTDYVRWCLFYEQTRFQRTATSRGGVTTYALARPFELGRNLARRAQRRLAGL